MPIVINHDKYSTLTLQPVFNVIFDNVDAAKDLVM